MSRRISGVLSLLVLLAVLVSGCAGGGSSEPYAVSGRVVDTEGNGVEGVLLQFSGGQNGSATTDEDGIWQETLRGTTTITPGKVGWAFEPPKRIVKGPAENVDFLARPSQASSFADITIVDNFGYQYGGGHYPGGVIRPVTFIADGTVQVRAHEVFQEYPGGSGLYGVLHASSEVVISPEINGEQIAEQQIRGEGVVEFSFDQATSLYVSGTGAEVHLYAFPIPFYSWDNHVRDKMQLPVEYVTETLRGRYNGFIVAQAPHTFVFQEDIPFEDTVHKHACPLKPLDPEYSRYHSDVLPSVPSVHFLSDLPLVIQCSAPTIEDYGEEWIYSAQMTQRQYHHSYELWAISDDTSSPLQIVRQVLDRAAEHAEQNYLPPSIEIDKMMIYVLSGEIAEEMGSSRVTSDYAYEDFGFANIAAMILDPALSTPQLIDLLCWAYAQTLSFNCYAAGPLVPYTWFHRGITLRFSAEILESFGYSVPPLPPVSEEGYKYVDDMEKYLYVDWTDPHGKDLSEIAIVIDDNEIGRNFMAYLQEVYGDDALKDYLGAIAPVIRDEVIQTRYYGGVWYKHNITCWDTLKEVTSQDVFKNFKDWYDRRHGHGHAH